MIVDVPIDYKDNKSLCAAVSEGVGH
ncbi:hypothetical protein NBG4_460023 [Candidatus Sulfobium mesophilum]|uniref:Uncharacterized protein n=1 Tax=Candidatus Sulfobium mesophilum TaxID=2016548 RepID=A0A2U3QIL5_9BACT|nr:hypothetical protein NBG4_460023 [Candidatus Sulfobium mesophilum]